MTPDRAAPLRASSVRIPGWARNEPVPSDLYRFLDPCRATARARRSTAQPVAVDARQGLRHRSTAPGRPATSIELTLPMPVRRVRRATTSVEADRGRVALQRGPIVYAAEWPDNPNGKVRNLVLPDTATLTAEFRPDLLNGVHGDHGRRLSAWRTTRRAAVTRTEQPFVAIPYYAWANRGRGQMMVWLAATRGRRRSPTPWPTVATTSTVSVSGKSRRNPRTINDGEEPPSSDRPCVVLRLVARSRARPSGSSTRSPRPATVSEASGLLVRRHRARRGARAGVMARRSTRTARSGSRSRTSSPTAWRATGTTRPFTPVTTDELRLEVTMQPKWSAGVQEWKVK